MNSFWHRFILWLCIASLFFEFSIQKNDKFFKYCDFTKPSCTGWKYDNNTWKWIKPTTDSLAYDGPPAGSYMEFALMANFNDSKLTPAIFLIKSQSFNISSNVSCFHFNYYMMDFGLDANQITLSTVNGSTVNEVWSTSGQMVADRWFDAKVQIDQQGQFNLKFVASGEHGFVALQSFHFTDSACNVDMCTFESGSCSWTSDSKTFKITKARYTESPLTGDHTSAALEGKVMYLSTNKTGATYLTGPKLSHFSWQCFSFWYLKTGKLKLKLFAVKNLNTAQRENNLLWSNNLTDPTGEWVQIGVRINIRDEINMVFEADKNDESKSTFSLDDTSFTAGACDDQIDCSFTGTFCSWKDSMQHSTLRWSTGPGRVVKPSALKIAKLVDLYLSDVLYSDFTTIKNPASMQLNSAFVEVPNKNGACLRLVFLVASINLATDSFHLDQITVNGTQSTLWTFTNSSAIGEKVTHTVYIPPPKPMAPYRLALIAKSSNAGTYIAVSRVDNLDSSSNHCNKLIPGLATTTQAPTPTVDSNHTLDCSFETSMCNWKQGGNSNFQVGTAVTTFGNRMYLPLDDCTIHTVNGHFLYQYTASPYVSSEGIITANNPYQNQDVCFSFWYYMYTDQASSFTLAMDNGDMKKQRIVYRGSGGFELKWNKVYFTIVNNGTFLRFVFHSQLKSGGLAIDDIKVTSGSCSPTTDHVTTCQFENDKSCIFEPLVNADGIKWGVFEASSFKLHDHTTLSGDGHFYGLDLSLFPPSKSTFPVYKVESTELSIFDSHCLQFSYLLDNVLNTTTLFYEIHTEEDFVSSNLRVWSVGGSTLGMFFNHRTSLKLPTSTASKYRLKFGVDPAGKSGQGRVFLDDITIKGGSFCHNINKCDFEEGNTCTLEPVLSTPGNSLNIVLKGNIANLQNRTVLATQYFLNYTDRVWHVFSPLQSPKYLQYDYSFQTSEGKYLLLTGFNTNDRGVILTEKYSLNNRNGFICLTFAVFISSGDINSTILEVYQGESLWHESVGFKLWDIRRPTSKWEVYNIKATPNADTSKDLFFYFVGTIGNNTNYIALDEISVEASDCSKPSNFIPSSTEVTTSTPTNDFLCDSGKRISMSQKCDWHKDCKNGEDEAKMSCGSCNFKKHSLCHYEVISSFSNPKYSFHFSDFVNVGPSSGSQENSLYMIALSAGQGTASLLSPLIHQSYISCSLSFSYAFNSTEASNASPDTALQVFLKIDNQNYRVLIWQSNFVPLDKLIWHEVNLNLRRIRHSFQIEFQAKNNDILVNKYHAIDDIDLDSCGPSKPSLNDPQCEGQFRCKNANCISKESVCDFEDDCDDNSEEINCDQTRMTSFENGFGRWGTVGMRKGWTVQMASNDFRVSPAYDHSTRVSSGHFMFAKTSAEISSPSLYAGKGCRIGFYLFKNTPQSSLIVSLTNLNTGAQKLRRNIVYQSYNWVMYLIPLDLFNSSVPVAVKLSAPFGDASTDSFATPYIAVDDIFFTSECTILDKVPTPPTLPNHSAQPTPKPNGCLTFSCIGKNGTQLCLPPSNLCDFIEQCRQGEDEKNCFGCTFEYGHMCHWSSLENGNVGNTQQFWSVIRPAGQSEASLPKVDADGNRSGGYIAISTSDSASDTQYTILRSPQINGRTSTLCTLQFSFFSQFGCSVHVKKVQNGLVNSLLGERRFSTGWTTLQVEIGQQAPGFSVDIGVANSHRLVHFKDAALDNVQMINCDSSKAVVQTNGSKSVSCSFESNLDPLCGWDVTGVGSRSKWERTNSIHREPGNDHTSLIIPKPKLWGTWLTSQATVDGRYETDYLMTKVPLKKGTFYCFSFWYFFYGIELDSSIALYASKRAEAVENPEKYKDYSPLWYTNIPLTRNWALQSIEIPNQDTDFYLIFVGKVTTTTVMGLDDFLLINGTCKSLSNSECSFEVNMCNWFRVNSGWERNQKATMYKDHSVGTVNGHYLAVTTPTVDQVPAIQLKMSTQSFTRFRPPLNFLRRPYCLKLYYYWDSSTKQSTDTLSKFSVMIKERGRIYQNQDFFLADNINAGFTGEWNLAEFNFRASRFGILEIDANITQGSTKLLIDDTSLHSGTCSVSGSCDFEQNMCGWQNSGTSLGKKRVFWLRIQPNSMFLKGTFLKFDSTTRTQNGNYLVLPNQMIGRAFSVIKSPLLHRSSSKVCFSLYYFARGTSNFVPAFTVSLYDLTRHKSTNKVVNATQTLFDWKLYKREFSNLPATYQFYIETFFNGPSNATLQSDIGIDDIRIENGGCSGQQPAQSTTPLPPNEKIFDCTFDESVTCNWQYNNTAWKVTDFKDSTEYYSPQHDHTYQDNKGKYLLFTKNSASQISFSISTKVPLKYDKDHCLTMWYFEDGEDDFQVQILNKLPKYTVLVHQYNSAIENRRRWSLVKADIPFSVNYNVTQTNLIIRYSPSSTRMRQFSIFALDDIRVRPGKCQHQFDYTYTFGIGYEDLDLETIQPLSGSIGRLYTSSSEAEKRSNVPQIDHTTNSAKGTYYLFMNENHQAQTTYIDTLSMPHMKAETSESCVRFAYQIAGNVNFKVFVMVEDSFDYKSQTPVWTSKYSKDTWTIAEFNKKPNFDHKVVFYMEKPADNSSFLAIDDIVNLQMKCFPAVDADFENGHIGSYTPYESKFRFGLFTAPPVDPNWPGPRYDHTTKNYGGGYLYLTAYRSVGTFTQIVSKVISGSRSVNSSSAYCLNLWTQLTTSDLQLKLHLVHFGRTWTDANRTTQIYSVGGVNQTDWTWVQVDLDQTKLMGTDEVQLIIEGRIGTNSRGAIAVDDIALKPGNCPSNHGNLLCEDGTTVTVEQICDFTKQCKSGLDELNCGGTVDICDFEKSGTCGWINVLNVPQKWFIASGKSANNFFAPPFDGSASPSGHYLLMGKTVPTMGVSSHAEVALNYPNPTMYLKNAYHTCVLILDYYVNTTAHYSIDIRLGADLVNWNNIYRIEHMPIGNWRKAYAHIGKRFTPFMVDISGRLADSTHGALALDNLHFVNCSMPLPLAANQSCGEKQFTCKKNRFCIDIDSLCDIVNDCGNGEDEASCSNSAQCNFEFSLFTCGITDDKSSDSNVEWTIKSGFDAEDTYFPKIDNTKRSTSGHFFGLAPKTPLGKQKITNMASFYSPMMTIAPNQQCHLRFFYFINDEPVKAAFTELRIFVWHASKSTQNPIAIGKFDIGMKEDLQQRWNKGIVSFQSDEPFRFVFRGFLGSKNARLSVDDISFNSNCILSTAKPFANSTTQAPTTQSVQTNPLLVTTIRPFKNESPKHNKGGIVAAILTPIFLMIGIALGYYGYRRYQAVRRTDENFSLTMRGIMSRSYNN